MSWFAPFVLPPPARPEASYEADRRREGASSDRRKYGSKAVRAYLQAGYDVYPVHPSEPSVERQPAYKSVTDVPAAKLDRVVFSVPPAAGLRVLDEVTAKPVGTVYLSPGADAPEVVDKAKLLGLNVLTGCAIIAVGVRRDMFPDE